MRPHKTLRLIRDGSRNVHFQDLIRLAEGFGFRVVRINGSHHMLSRAGVPKLLNFQDMNGMAKPYQVRQLLRWVEQYNLKLEDEP